MVQRERRLRRISVYAPTSVSRRSFFSIFIVVLSSFCILGLQPSLVPSLLVPLHRLVFIGMSSSPVRWGPSEEDVLCSLYGNVPHGALL